MTTKLLVLGGSGFVGQAVRRALRAGWGQDMVVRWGVRAGAGVGAIRVSDELREVDLTDARTIRGLCAGIDVVINTATRFTGTRSEVFAVNDVGSTLVVDECVRAGVHRLVRLSTTSVYGGGSFRGEEIHGLDVNPGSWVSESRASGDAAVLASGVGVVVRPHLVLGVGDRVVMPRVEHVVRSVGWVGGFRAQHSWIEVDALAVSLLRAGLGGSGVGTEIRLAAAPDPTTLREDWIWERFGGMPRHAPEISLSAALRHDAGASDARWEHDLRFLCADHVLTCRC